MLQAEADDDAQRELDKVVFSEATCCGCTRFAWRHLCLYSFAWGCIFGPLWHMGAWVAPDYFDWCVWWAGDRGHRPSKERHLRRCGRHEYWLKAATMFYSVWKSTSASGAPDNSSLSHFPAMTRPSWLGHRAGVASMTRRPRTRRKNLISTQVLLLADGPTRGDEPDGLHFLDLRPVRAVVPAGAEPHRRGRARVVASPPPPRPATVHPTVVITRDIAAGAPRPGGPRGTASRPARPAAAAAPGPRGRRRTRTARRSPDPRSCRAARRRCCR